MVAMVMRAIYLRVKRALMQWAGCRDEVPGLQLILVEKLNVRPSHDGILEVVIKCLRGKQPDQNVSSLERHPSAVIL